MIEIIGIGSYDTTKKWNEQSEEVVNWVIGLIDSCYSANCSEFDEFERPKTWLLNQNGVKIKYERLYQEASHQRMLKETLITISEG